MKPIRKDEQEYMRNYISKKFGNRAEQLKSERQIVIDTRVDKNIVKFRKTLNIDNQLKEVQKLSDQFDDFVNEYVTRRDKLKRELYNKADKLEDKLEKWCKVRRWDKKPDIVDESTNAKENPFRADKLDKYIREVCEEETIKAYDKSKEGLAIRQLEDAEEEAENALYSGGSIQSVRQYVHGIFKNHGIRDNIAKNLLMLSNK